MHALRTTADVAAAIVAWHNRHPLARRIGPDQVHGVGVVDLPLALPVAPRRGAARLLFSAQALYHAAPDRLARWLQRHAQRAVGAPEDWPRRPLDVEPALVGDAERAGCTEQRVASVLTAAVDVDGKRLRVLLSAPRRIQVFGSRALSPPRGLAALAVAVAFPIVIAGGSALVGTAPSSPTVAPLVAAAPASPAPTVEPARTGASAASPAEPAPATAPAPSLPASSAIEAAQVQTAASAAAMPRLGELIDPSAREAARAQSRALRAAHAASAASAARQVAAASAPAPAIAAVPRARIDGPVYAIATPPIARRESALAQLALWRGLAAQTRTDPATRLDLMPVGAQWRVVWWPHRDRKLADRLLADVGARGLRAELIAF